MKLSRTSIDVNAHVVWHMLSCELHQTLLYIQTVLQVESPAITMAFPPGTLGVPDMVKRCQCLFNSLISYPGPSRTSVQVVLYDSYLITCVRRNNIWLSTQSVSHSGSRCFRLHRMYLTESLNVSDYTGCISLRVRLDVSDYTGCISLRVSMFQTTQIYILLFTFYLFIYCYLHSLCLGVPLLTFKYEYLSNL